MNWEIFGLVWAGIAGILAWFIPMGILVSKLAELNRPILFFIALIIAIGLPISLITAVTQ